MNNLSFEQRRVLADFLGQFAAIILGSGLIVPLFSENLPDNVLVTGPVSMISTGLVVAFMLRLLGGKKR